jgi:signal transduction histidine kinase
VTDEQRERTLRQAIDDECMRLSFAHLYFVTWATMFAVLALAVIMSSYVPLESLAWWVIVYVALSQVRLSLALWYRRRPRTSEELRRKLPVLALGFVLAPLSWSAIPFLTPRADTAAYLIQLLFAGGLVAGGAQTLIGTPRILLANTLLTVAPFIARLLTSGITEQAYMGAIAIVYYLMTLEFGRRNLKLIRESIALRFGNERLVAQLTQARDEAEAARALAESANDSKNRFLAAASHDIRQPLHAAWLFLGALEHETRTRPLPVIARLRAALAAARQMLDTLLDVSLLDAGVVKRSDTEFRAEAAGRSLIEMFDPIANRKGIALGLRCPADLWLRSDPTLVQRVLVNLVGNAVKFTERGAVLIAFRCRGDVCLVQVWDTGVGIAASDQAAIFDELTQLRNPERDRTRGTGLGLTIVRRLCRLLGTDISVRSRPGHGSVFAFTLPSGKPSGTLPAVREGSVAHAAHAAHARIMVVDDDALVRDGLRTLLSAWGYDVRVATGVEDARETAGAGPPPDLVLVDYRLRDEKTASDALREIRHGARREVPAIVITGDTHPQRIREAKALGYPVIFKPLPPDALRTALREALSRSA